jgi:hypothetical protein
MCVHVCECVRSFRRYVTVILTDIKKPPYAQSYTPVRRRMTAMFRDGKSHLRNLMNYKVACGEVSCNTRVSLGHLSCT